MSKAESPGALEVSLVDAFSSFELRHYLVIGCFELRHYFRTSIFPNSAQQARVGAQVVSLPPWKVSK